MGCCPVMSRLMAWPPAGGGGDDSNGPLRVELFGEGGANERVIIDDEDSQGTQGVARHKRLRPVTT